MEDQVLVREIDRFTSLEKEPKAFAGWQLARRTPIIDTLPVDHLHHQVRSPLPVGAAVVDAADVRMDQACENPSLEPQALQNVVGVHAASNALERYRHGELTGSLRKVHRGLTAASKAANNSVRTDLFRIGHDGGLARIVDLRCTSVKSAWRLRKGRRLWDRSRLGWQGVSGAGVDDSLEVDAGGGLIFL